MSANKVTYVSLSADDPAIDAGFGAAIAEARAALGAPAPLRVAGATRAGAAARSRAATPPTRAWWWRGSRRAARTTCATPSPPRARPSPPGARARGRSGPPSSSAPPRSSGRASSSCSVWMILEMGKNRVEALGEIEETADLLAYYAGQMRANGGYVRADGPPGAHRPQRQRAAPLRRLGGDRALELPVRAAGRAGGGGAGRRQHGRLQAVVGDAALRR